MRKSATFWTRLRPRRSLDQHFPTLPIDGFDNDQHSITTADRNAAAAGVADRVTFYLADAAAIPGNNYDLAVVFEAIHHMAHPVPALRRAKTPGGTGDHFPPAAIPEE
jgi:hypothetical protein